MDQETALPTGAESAAAGEQATQAAATATPEQQPTEGQQPGAEAASEGEGGDKPAKKEKTAEQREIERLRRRVDNLTRQKYEARAQAPQPEQRQQQSTQASTDEAVTLTRAELDRLIAEQARELAPAVKEQQAEVERRNGVLTKLSKEWGKEEFDAKASDLDDVFGGLTDRSGRPKPATDAIFDADDPKAVIEYLTDPDNADEAERISRMAPTQAGRAIAKLEAKLEQQKREAKPKASNAPRPIESVKGGGVPNGMPDPSDTKAYIKWANEQDARR